jgi:hypothetical protein
MRLGELSLFLKSHVPINLKSKFLSDAMKQFIFSLSSWLLAHATLAERVTVEYEAEAGTVVDQPFGMTVPRLTIVRGYISYETNTADLLPNDPMRGSFVLTGTWDFRAEFLGRVVTGSGTASSSTNLFGSPTLRFEDGTNNTLPGLMSVDGVLDAGVGLGFSISGAAKDLPTDQLPTKFTFNPPPSGASHTFVLSSTSGRMLLQFRSFRQVAFAIKTITRSGDVITIVWFSVNGKRYALDFSTDLVNWSIIQSGLVGNSLTTSVTDNLTQRYSGGPLPQRGFYRIRDLGPP